MTVQRLFEMAADSRTTIYIWGFVGFFQTLPFTQNTAFSAKV